MALFVNGRKCTQAETSMHTCSIIKKNRMKCITKASYLVEKVGYMCAFHFNLAKVTGKYLPPNNEVRLEEDLPADPPQSQE